MEQMGLNFQAASKATQSANSGANQKGDEPQVLSVYELNRRIRGCLETSFDLIWLQAEISNFKAHTSGHWYFSLKDSKAQVNAVMFRGNNTRLKFRPENGMEVLIRGKVTVYEPRGNYQVFCETIEPLGAGALQKQFEQLKQKLSSEGLFDSNLKKPLPRFPKHIAVVTSPTGAAIQDILNVLSRRFRGLKVTVVPTIVQGAAAAPQIVEALSRANRLKNIDAIIVGRGGGSMEDLWCFNDEAVARAIVACEKPVISAVGHEIDFTISDFVADFRAPTPSAAAEVVSANILEIKDKIDSLEANLVRSIEYKFSELRQTVDHLKKQLIDPKKQLRDYKRRCLELHKRLQVVITRKPKELRQRQIEAHRRLQIIVARRPKELRVQQIDFQRRLQQSVSHLFKEKRKNLVTQGLLLDSLSPLKVVERGYSIVKKQGVVVKSFDQLQSGDELQLQFAKGQATAQVTQVSKK